MRPLATCFALISIGVVPAMATGAPTVVPGWPVTAGAGSVHPGPGGGIVVIEDRAATIGAFRLNGRLRWLNAAAGGCSPCRDRSQDPGLQEDGNYGPIGPEKATFADPPPDFWGVGPTGTTVGGCNGLALANGTCITYGGLVAGVTAMRGGVPLWTYTGTTIRFAFEARFTQRPPIGHDRLGTVYVQGPRGQGVVALDEATGSERWIVRNAYLKTALTSGAVLLESGVGLVRRDRDGNVIWTNAGWIPASAGFVEDDEAHDRLYVSAASGNGLIALDSRTGARLWRAKVADRVRLLSIDESGIVLASTSKGSPSTTHGGTYTLRAIRPNGKLAWEWQTLQYVSGARRLGDGTIAVSTSSYYSSLGLLWRIDPRKSVRPVSRVSVSVIAPKFRASCTKPQCHFNPRVGTILGLSLPSATSIAVRLVDSKGTRSEPLEFRAPAGVSAARIFADFFAPLPGRYTIEVRGTALGRKFAQRVPITVT